MEQHSMTALVSAFSRAYHATNNEVKVFDDRVAKKLLTENEYHQISKNMADGISFFNPAFVGNSNEALRWVVDNQLSPSPLGRAAFAEKSLERAVKIGTKQYLIMGAGYDTFAYRQPEWAKQLEVFEVDHPATGHDKQNRIKYANITIQNNGHYIETDFTKERWQDSILHSKYYDKGKITFISILGVAYYLSQAVFEKLIAALSDIIPEGSTIVLDYPDENSYNEKAGMRAKKQAMLAGGANEKMLASYSYAELERLLALNGLRIYEHLTPKEMTEQYFATYNHANPTHMMTAFDNVNYCLAVKKK